ncbi:hypothetical protein FRZ03_13325 [Streptomyces misionensis]|uniref:Uncharacterized protein n=1 Tax=Streptomyces misionensis TaxID=67331 RepID=A0A5C6JUD9_9ACTN|nr:hypothetical protein [Streptomyces misionensis]TWV48121.1 hypothetical protein FRZ03_13325 [Streptomyces misionensis]
MSESASEAETTARAVPGATPPSEPGPEHEPAAPAPLDLPRTPTGDAEIDARLARLADADHLPTDGHVEVYEDVHQGLRDALTALDARPGPPAPPPSHQHRS